MLVNILKLKLSVANENKSPCDIFANTKYPQQLDNNANMSFKCLAHQVANSKLRKTPKVSVNPPFNV